MLIALVVRVEYKLTNFFRIPWITNFYKTHLDLDHHVEGLMEDKIEETQFGLSLPDVSEWRSLVFERELMEEPLGVPLDGQ